MAVIGKRGGSADNKYTERSVIEVLNRHFMSSPKYVLNNLYVYNWESDFLAITKSWYVYEVEVKISVSDFKNDFSKTEKHKQLLYGKSKNKPNYFYYAVPEKMIDIKDVPSYAGLIYVRGKQMYIVKKAPKILSTALDLAKYGQFLMDKFYYNMKTWEKRARERADADPKKLRMSGAKKAAEALILKSWKSFKECCEFVYYPYNDRCCPCCSKSDIISKDPLKSKFVDCNMQCEKGSKFVRLLSSK